MACHGRSCESLIGGILGLLQKKSMERLTTAVDLMMVLANIVVGTVSIILTSCKDLRSLFES